MFWQEDISFTRILLQGKRQEEERSKGKNGSRLFFVCLMGYRPLDALGKKRDMVVGRESVLRQVFCFPIFASLPGAGGGFISTRAIYQKDE